MLRFNNVNESVFFYTTSMILTKVEALSASG